MAGFSGAPTNLFVTQSVVFTNTSTGGITNSVWNYGDGNRTSLSGASASNNVTDTYNNPGTYTVRLMVSGLGGSSTNTQSGYIVAFPNPAIDGAQMSDGNFVLSGSNEPAGAPYRILTVTNVALPLPGWTPVVTNTFAPDGSYRYTNSSVRTRRTSTAWFRPDAIAGGVMIPRGKTAELQPQ